VLCWSLTGHERLRTLKTANAGERRSWRESIMTNLPARRGVLSARAENVLKALAAELTGEDPPRGRWVPSSNLLRKLSYKDLQATRNCGPQTTAEIVRWAGSQGVIIERPFHAGKSLSAMWRDIIARSSTGQFTRAEIAEALEKSLRRKNTRIPVAIQNLLVKALNDTGKQSSAGPVPEPHRPGRDLAGPAAPPGCARATGN
jgi:hypothetical protein